MPSITLTYAAGVSLSLGEIRMRDPFILDAGGEGFLLFGTTDENVWGGPGTGFNCYRSADAVAWEGPSAAFRPPAGFWGTTQFWAPEVHAYEGWYAMFATFASVGADAVRGTAVLRADQPDGPYVPWSQGPVTPLDRPCLDGTLHIDDAGHPWIVYSRGAEGTSTAPPIADGEMWARRLNPDLRQGVGESLLLFTASAAPWARPFNPPTPPPPGLELADDPLFTDGPFLFRSPSGELRMLWSSFGDEGYAMGIATSKSGDVTGPWIQQNRPLWERNGGHGMLVDVGIQTYLVFHAPNETPNERVRMVPVANSDDGLLLVGT